MPLFSRKSPPPLNFDAFMNELIDGCRHFCLPPDLLHDRAAL